MSGQPQFTVEDVVAEIRALAAERPDYVYRPEPLQMTCSYVTGEHGEGCIVGQALMRLGVSEHLLAEFEAEQEGGVAAHTVITALLGPSATGPLMDWIDGVQDQQDVARPWGKAVTLADTVNPPWFLVEDEEA